MRLLKRIIIALSLVILCFNVGISRNIVKDTTHQSLVSKQEAFNENMFTEALRLSMESENFLNLDYCLSDPIVVVFTEENGGTSIVTVPKDSAIVALGVVLHNLPPATAKLYKLGDPEQWVYTLEFKLKGSDVNVYIGFYVQKGKIVKIYLH